MTYRIILSDTDGESLVGTCLTLEAAKEYLQSVRYYPTYMRSAESLDISEDGMTGEGYDAEGGHFTYSIKTA